jgi:hypothetical protein
VRISYPAENAGPNLRRSSQPLPVTCSSCGNSQASGCWTSNSPVARRPLPRPAVRRRRHAATHVAYSTAPSLARL